MHATKIPRRFVKLITVLWFLIQKSNEWGIIPFSLLKIHTSTKILKKLLQKYQWKFGNEAKVRVIIN